VGVFTESGTEVRFPNFRDVGAVTEATLDTLPLRVGQRYVVAVQAVGPAGPGAEGRSDGVRVTDTQGPRASVAVSPDPSWPVGGVEPTLTGACSDLVGLRRVRVEALDVSGAVLLATVADVDAAGAPERSAGGRWGGTAMDGTTVSAGDYLARVTCVDLEGREAQATATFTLDPSAGPPASDAGVPGPDAGRRVPAAADESGCGCRTAGAAAVGGSKGGGRFGGGALALGLVGVAALVERRHRSRRRAAERPASS
jgi:hypothetical protein